MRYPIPEIALIIVTLGLSACGAEPTPFVVVGAPGALTPDLPAATVVSAEELAEIAAECPEAVVASVASAAVVRRAWDVVHYDGLALDAALATLFSINRQGESFEVCEGTTSRAGEALLCDRDAGADALLSPADLSLICDEGWALCHDALDSLAPGWFYPIDARYLPAVSAQDAAACSCAARQVEGNLDTLINYYYRLYNQLYLSPATNLAWYLALQGDASITVRNVAPSWSVESPSPDSNAGVCGVWVFGDDDFLALAAPGEDGEPSTLEQVCGGVSVPDKCPADGCPEPQPLTVLRADVAVGKSTARAPYRVGGVGDLAGAFQLPPADAPARRCPTCENGACEQLAGAVTLLFGRDLRYRVQNQEGPLHVIAAECPHPKDYAGSGWQRACWHTEVPRDALNAGRHLEVSIGGITEAVGRPIDPDALAP